MQLRRDGGIGVDDLRVGGVVTRNAIDGQAVSVQIDDSRFAKHVRRAASAPVRIAVERCDRRGEEIVYAVT